MRTIFSFVNVLNGFEYLAVSLPSDLDFALLKTIDRNSQGRFEKCMVAAELQKSPVHDFMQSPLFNHS
jgi:hypothetical protein